MWLHEMLRYGGKGALTTSLNVVFMAALVEVTGYPPEIAAVISTLSLLLLGYAIMNRWVFADEPTPIGLTNHLKRGGAYYAVILTGKGVNYLLFLGLLGVGIWYPAAWLIGSLTVFCGTFTANRHVWKAAGDPA